MKGIRISPFVATVYVIFIFVIFYVSFRSFVYDIKTYQFNKNALKKREKGQTFLEWLFLSRFKEEIPLFFRVFNYVLILSHLLSLVFYIFCYITNIVSAETAYHVLAFLLFFDGAWWIVFMLLFVHRGRSPKNGFERWIKKKRGQKPKRKK